MEYNSCISFIQVHIALFNFIIFHGNVCVLLYLCLPIKYIEYIELFNVSTSSTLYDVHTCCIVRYRSWFVFGNVQCYATSYNNLAILITMYH